MAGWLSGTTQIISSGERKALEAAGILADAFDPRRPAPRRDARERQTGFLPPEEFEAVADAFFRRPGESIRGWERALDTQQRIVREAEAVLAKSVTGDILLVGHGAVGTLLGDLGVAHDDDAIGHGERVFPGRASHRRR